MSSDDRKRFESDILEILTGNRRNTDRVRAIIDYFDDSTIFEAYPKHSRHVEVEQVEIGGLEIGLDAHGHAACVRFPEGAEHDG